MRLAELLGIEYFGGKHWHGSPYEGDERKAHFWKYGFGTLIIWNWELQETYTQEGFYKLLTKLVKFLNDN